MGTRNPPSKRASRTTPAATPAAPPKHRGRASVRSEDGYSVPFYKPADPGDEGPSLADVLAAGGLQPSRLLSDDELKKVLRVDLDITTTSDNAVAQYARAAAALALPGLTPDVLRDLHDRAVFLKARAATYALAAQVVQQQTLVAASDLHNALLRIHRRIKALRPEDPEIERGWDFLFNYMARVYPGRGPGAATVDEDGATEEGTAPAAAPTPPAPAAPAAPAASPAVASRTAPSPRAPAKRAPSAKRTAAPKKKRVSR